MLMGRSIAVLTCSYGSDAIVPFPTKDTTAEYIHMTTDKTRKPDGWDTRVVRVPEELNMRRASRIPKMQPWRITRNATWIIWVDSRVQLKLPARQVIDVAIHSCSYANVWAHRHRSRHGIYDEAAAIMKRYDSCAERDWAERLVEQIRVYALNRWPKDHGLWEMGLMIWNMQDANKCAALGNEWRRQYMAGCERDQISFPIAAYNVDAKVGDLPGNLARSEVCIVHPPPTVGS